jgi:hypothetical protein
VNLEELYLEINSTFAGAKNVHHQGGREPAGARAGQGDLVVAINAASARRAAHVGALRAEGRLAERRRRRGATGTIKAIHMPRTA